MKNNELPSILDTEMECSNCGWHGTAREVEHEIYDDGLLGCPECLCIVRMKK